MNSILYCWFVIFWIHLWSYFAGTSCIYRWSQTKFLHN